MRRGRDDLGRQATDFIRREAPVAYGAIEKLDVEVLAANPGNVAEYKAGKEKAFNALVGQVMKAAKGKANPQQVNDLLKAKLAG